MPTIDRTLSLAGLTGRAGAFEIGPVDLSVDGGRVLVVLGPSGAGKTMLLETIAGLRPLRSGHIRLAGADLDVVPPERRRIGLVFQDAALFPHLSVRQNVAFGPGARGDATGTDTDALLRRLGVAGLADRSPGSLSGGERQRVALARALAIRPRLLLLDEPLSALDQPTREDMRALLQELLADLEIPAVHVTHDRDEAMSIADDLAVIVGGRLRQAGPARLVAAEPADADVARLLGWSWLGRGAVAGAEVRSGGLVLPSAAPPDIAGSVDVFYRPEDVVLGPLVPGAPSPSPLSGSGITGAVEQILPTRPLARVSLATDPPMTALMLHRDLDRLDPHLGGLLTATLPPGGIRVFPAGQ